MAVAIHLREAVSLSGHFPLLSGLTLDVEEGEVVHLVGANGAGKTSLLRLVAGLTPIVSGRAVVLGYDLSKDRVEVRRELGFFGHETFLYDDLTVQENLTFAVRAARGERSRIPLGLERLGLTGRLGSTRVDRLSAGQRRRTALAILFARSPRLWLLDEPHAGLDAEGREVVDSLIDDARAARQTVVFSSHELRASLLSDRVISLAGGRVNDVKEVDRLAPADLIPKSHDREIDPAARGDWSASDDRVRAQPPNNSDGRRVSSSEVSA